MTLFRSLSNIKMNRSIYFILMVSIFFVFEFNFSPSLSKVYTHLGYLFSGVPEQSPEEKAYIAAAASSAATVAAAAASSDGSYDYTSAFPSPKPLTLTFICTYLLFHSIILTLVSIPRMNDCRASRWLALFLLIPELNYVIVLLLVLLPRAKHVDQVRSSIWSDLWKAVMTLTLLIVVGFTVAVFGTLFLYTVQMTYFQKEEAVTSPSIMGQD